MKISLQLTVFSRAEWRAWLAANHDKEKEVWLVYFKAASGQTGIGYEESVKEALCFGWIDSIIQKIDEEKYARKFNPRRAGSYWSAVNKKRVEKLSAEGRMTPLGLAKFDPQAAESASVEAQKIRRGEVTIPAEITLQLKAHPLAWENFQGLPPSHQRQYVGWIMSAKREETRQRRLAEAVSMLEQGQRLGMK